MRRRGTLLQKSCLCVFDSVWTDKISTGRAFILTICLQHHRPALDVLFFFFLSPGCISVAAPFLPHLRSVIVYAAGDVVRRWCPGPAGAGAVTAHWTWGQTWLGQHLRLSALRLYRGWLVWRFWFMGWMRTLGSPVLFLKGEKKAGHGRCTVSPTSARGQQTTASQNGRQPSEGQKREVLDRWISYIVDVL